MYKQRFLVILYIIAVLMVLMPSQVLAENEVTFVEESVLPIPDEVLEEIDFSEAISIQQVYEQIEWQIFALVNQERQRLGKPALQMDSVLRDICRNHSKDIFDRDLFNVTPPDGSVPGHWSPATGFESDRLASRGYTSGVHYTALAENVASNRGFSDPGAVAFNGWMNSSDHRDTIRDVANRGFNYTGIGVYRASNGGYYFTQKFVTAPSPLSTIITPPTDPPPPTGPSVPTLASPANGSTVAGSGTDSSITFQWNASSGADRYQMRLRAVGEWQPSPNIYNTNMVANNFPNDGRRYEWAVRAGNSAGQWSDWSSPWTFTNGTGSTPPSTSFSDVPTNHPFYAEINALVASGITTGYADGTFKPSAIVTRMATATFLYRALNLADPGVTVPTFSDVPLSHPFFTEIEALAALGIVNGFADGTFRPSANVTRMAMAAFLVRGFNLEAAHSASSYPTLGSLQSTGTWSYTGNMNIGRSRHTATLLQDGRVLVTGGVASGNNFPTRTELYDAPLDDTTSFSDVPSAHPFYGEINAVVAAGIATGYNDGSFRPWANVTRMAMAAFLYRGLELDD